MFKFMGGLEQDYYTRLEKIWLQQYWKLILCYNGKQGEKMKLGSDNYKVGLQILKFPKNNFSVKGTMLMGKESRFDDKTLVLCHTSAFNAWNSDEESEGRTESFIKITQGTKEAFTDFFLQRLMSTVNKMVSDPEIRQILIEPLVFENANSEYKMVIGPLKARSPAIDEWIRRMADIGSHSYDAALIGEIISRNFKRNQNVRCFNCN